MFNFFKNKVKFDIFDKSTWHLASKKKPFIWNNEHTFFNVDTDKDITEKEMVAILNRILDVVENTYTCEEMTSIKLTEIINIVIGIFCKGESLYDAVSAVSNEIYNRTHKVTKPFNPIDPETYKYATDKPIIWNGKNLLNKDNKPHTEKDIVDLSNSIFNFLEREGDIISLDKKITAITKLLNRMENPEYYMQLEKQKEEENEKNIPNGLFDPRNSETYKYAKNKPLIIDGIRIFDTYTDSIGKKIKEDITEKEFVSQLTMSLELHKKSMLWDVALKSVKEDFINQGIKEPTKDTPGYDDEVNRIYQSMFNKSNARLTKKQEKEHIEKYIKQKIAECKPRKITSYGVYKFTEAQMEVLNGFSKEKLEKIGKIMTTEKGSSKRAQSIFNSLAIDGFWVTKLHKADTMPDLEENIMFDYYLGFEDFENKEEIIDFFNKRPYLAKRPELKKKVIEAIIDRERELSELDD